MVDSSRRSSAHQAQDGGPVADDAPPPPPYQLSAAIDSLGALRITDVPPRTTSAMAMSPVRSSQSQRSRPSDVTSVHSSRSAHSNYTSPHDSWGYEPSIAETDRTSSYSQEERYGPGPMPPPNGVNGGHFPPGPGLPAGPHPSHNHGYVPQPAYPDQRPYGYAPTPQPMPPPQQEYNPLYLAASNVLGMGPPPGAAAPPAPPPAVVPMRAPSLPYSPAQFAPPPRPSSAMSSMSYNPNGHYMPPGVGPPMHPGSSSSSLYRAPTNASSIPEESEIERRPPLNRQGTTDLASLQTKKTKAIDLSAPPYTK